MKSSTHRRLGAGGVVAVCLRGLARRTNPPVPPQTFALPEGATITVNIDSGTLSVTEGEAGVLTLSGYQAAQSTVTATQAAGEVQIRAQAGAASWLRRSGPPPQLDLTVPPGSTVRVDTFDAEVNVRAFHGGVDITSMAGTILAEAVTGTAALRSNRGAITVRNSSGEIAALGNYGLLSLEGVSGKVSASTIMGTIRFVGTGGAGDTFHLETDHGPIEIRLGAAADLTVQVKSTSGEVDCVIPGLAPAGRGCQGKLGGGQAQLVVRTVSGNVSVQQLP